MGIENDLNRTCPFCGGEILKIAKKCKHCGEWINDENREQISLEAKKCPYCCKEIPKDAKKCMYCGEKIEKKGNGAVGCFINVAIWGIGILAVLITIILGENGEGIGCLLAIIMLFVWLYFIPSEIANANKHRHTLWIFIINLFFGWSILGWIATLIWACSDNG